MKKLERIQQELFFLNGRKNFNLRDIMDEFSISKRTALRDLQELERLGLPLYSNYGRWGGYQILENSLLPPIYFTEKEIFAIFYSLQTLNLLKEFPFGSSHKKIQNKLLNTFTPEKQKRIVQMMDTFHYEGIEQIAVTHNLEELARNILKNEVIRINYTRYNNQVKNILPTKLTMMDGYWYCTALDVNKKEWRVYRCDYIEEITVKDSYQETFSIEYLKQSYKNQQELYRVIPFKVKVSEIGKERFLKRNFSNMNLKMNKNENYIVGKFNESELDFLVNYFLSFGNHVEILEPNQLKEAYIKSIKTILNNY
ncbi:helix-turn-helix transcriptional regulator [Lactococcus garvieae]|uniref:helix-turn-helix transcriptional regulator n=1 Tax=Lactococcus garvieae TaxID=1363 RepID=UPI00398F182A